MGIFIKIAVLNYLAFETYEDLKKKTVSVSSIIVFSAAGTIVNLFGKNISLLNMFLGLAVGAGVMIIGKIMNDGIGIGDGAILSSVGIIIGGKQCLLLFFVAIMAAAFISLVLLLLKKVKLKQQLPFVPYILAGYIFLLVTYQ